MTTDSESGRWSLGAYLRFSVAVIAVLVLLAVLALAISPDGDSWRRALVAALTASGVASLLSGTFLAVRGGAAHRAYSRFLLAMLARLFVVAALAAFCLLRLGVEERPFLIWLVASYLVLLVVDSVFAVRAARSL